MHPVLRWSGLLCRYVGRNLAIATTDCTGELCSETRNQGIIDESPYGHCRPVGIDSDLERFLNQKQFRKCFDISCAGSREDQ